MAFDTPRKNGVIFDRPIFIVGHARGGSTMLASVIHWHSEVGVKSGLINSCHNLDEMLNLVFRPEHHIEYSESLEQKGTWFEAYGGGNEVFTHMGKELISEAPLKGEAESRLKGKLALGLNGNRLLVKAPSLSFKVKSIAQTFPGAKFVAVLRRGEEVVASWGKRSYGFGKKVDWGDTQYSRLTLLRGISIFTRKWLETIDYLESARKDIDIRFVSYEQLLERPLTSLQSILEFLELPIEPYVERVTFRDRSQVWRESIPRPYRWLLRQKVRGGNRKIGQLCAEPY